MYPEETPVVSVHGTVTVVCTVIVVTGIMPVWEAVAVTEEAQVTMAGLEGI